MRILNYRGVAAWGQAGSIETGLYGLPQIQRAGTEIDDAVVVSQRFRAK